MMYYCVYQYIALQYQTLAKIDFEQGETIHHS